MGTIYYETAPMPQTDGTNIVVNGDGKLDLGTDVTTKLSKLNSDGTLDFSNVDNAPTSLSGYGITDAYSKTEVDGKLDSWIDYPLNPVTRILIIKLYA